MKLATIIILTSFIGVYAFPPLDPPQGLKRSLTIGGSSIFRDPDYDSQGRFIGNILDALNDKPPGLKRCVADPKAVEAFAQESSKDSFFSLASKTPESTSQRLALRTSGSHNSLSARINKANILSSTKKTCLRSGKCFLKPGSVQKASSSFSKFLEKAAPIISVGIAVNEGYNDYQENKQIGRAVVTTGTSFAKNAVISSSVLYVSPLCGLAAPLCAIGGAVILGVYTPSSQEITDLIIP